jgi:hypothetical protein
MPNNWLLTNFEKALPAGKITRSGRHGTWHVMNYRTEDGLNGVLIMANPDARAPDIEIKLPLKGRYDIFLGCFRDYCDRLQVRLAGERCYDRLVYSYPYGKNPCFQDVFWRTVELDGSARLQIRQDASFRASVGYILARKTKRPSSVKRDYLLHVTDDGFMANWGVPRNREDASWIVEALARVGAQYVSRGYDCLCGMAAYYTRHASLQVDTANALRATSPAPIYREGFEILRDFQKARYAVPRRYYEFARQQGIQPLGYSRMAHIHAPPPWDAHGSRFYDDHPEFRCVDISGAPVCRLSIAFPEVRRAFFKLSTEQIEMGATGINNVFVRGLPMVLYERPVRERFRKVHGREMMRLPENDRRAQAVRAEFMTAFMREQREALDRAAGRHATVMVTVPSDRPVCEFFGLDIPGWIREGLIDILCPYRFGFDADYRKLDLNFFCRAVKGTNVLLLPHVRTWSDNLSQMMANALNYSRYPIDGFSVWDAGTTDPVSRACTEGLATKQGIREAIRRLKKGPHHRPIIMANQDGTLMNKYHFGWTF